MECQPHVLHGAKRAQNVLSNDFSCHTILNNMVPIAIMFYFLHYKHLWETMNFMHLLEVFFYSASDMIPVQCSAVPHTQYCPSSSEPFLSGEMSIDLTPQVQQPTVGMPYNMTVRRIWREWSWYELCCRRQEYPVQCPEGMRRRRVFNALRGYGTTDASEVGSSPVEFLDLNFVC